MMNAQTSGPKSPDFGKFTPITNAGLVNEFDGSLNYSIPVLSLPSGTKEVYNLALTYTSGKSPLEDASWVGFGWDLNPGVITRQVKGFPDDFDAIPVYYYNDVLPIFSHSEINSLNGEIFSRDNNGSFLNNQTFSNYGGYNSSYSASLNIAGYGGLGGSYDIRGNYGGSVSISPSLIINSLEKLKLDRLEKALLNTNIIVNSFYQASSSFLSLASIHHDFTNINNWGKGYAPKMIPDYLYSIDFNFLWKLQASYAGVGLEVGYDKLSFIGETMKYKPAQKLLVNGFLYSGNSYEPNKSTHLMDYYTESKSGLSVHRNKFLPIPYNNADNFVVSGIGLNGQFRLNSKKVGLLRPNLQSMSTVQTDVNLTTGVAIAPFGIMVGADQIVSNNSLATSKAKTSSPIENITLNYSENIANMDHTYERSIPYSKTSYKDFSPNYYFKFSGDMSKSSQYYNNIYGSDDNIVNMFSPIQSTLSSSSLNMKNVGNLNSKINENQPVSRSSYIKYIVDGAGLLSGFEITNNEGKRFVYDLPSYNQNEGNIQYAIPKLTRYSSGYISPTNYPFTNDGKIIYVDESTIKKIYTDNGFNARVTTADSIPTPDNVTSGSDILYVSGRITRQKYAAAFHLTAIYSPDYIDIDNNGPSLSDIGEYVVFKYWQKYSTASPYKWREPYVGLTYQLGQISSTADDIGTVSYGQKEVYYLKSIESKTHIAYFVTNTTTASSLNTSITGYSSDLNTAYTGWLNGSGSRLDALGANFDEYAALKGIAGTSALDYLQRIVLCSKDAVTGYPSKIVNVTHLNYYNTYPIWQGMPNSYSNVGKLSLKSVTVDNGNVIESQVSPYQFNYQATALSTPINAVNSHYSTITQNPRFNYWNIDKWGSYTDNLDENTSTYNTQIQNSDFIMGNNFVKQQNGELYDPSAWNLKEIIQPNQALTQIQYESNEYSYVQDLPADMMFKVSSYQVAGGHVKVILYPNNSINTTNVASYVSYLGKAAMDSMLLYKFLYNVEGSGGKFDSGNEYITGYAKLTGCTVYSGNGIELTFSDDLPVQKCRDFYKKNLMGLVKTGNNISPFVNIAGSSHSIDNTDYILNTYEKSHDAFIAAQSGNNDYEEKCNSIVVGASFIRLPLPKEVAKKGDGIRVKRIINVDNFDALAESGGSARYYGTEYYYCDSIINSGGSDVHYSSGVATNEPSISNEENALRKILDYNDGESEDDLRWNGNISFSYNWKGKDYEQYDGPLSEGILPGAKVNYSRVIIKPIDMYSAVSGYSTKNAIVKEYFTVKQFPYNMEYKITNQLRPSFSLTVNGSTYSSIYRKAVSPISNLLYSFMPVGPKIHEENSYMSQGYQFIINDMHGKPKSTSSYSATSLNDFNSWKLGTRTSYEYFRPGEAVPIFNNLAELTSSALAANDSRSFQYDWLGLNMFFSNESSANYSSTASMKEDVDLTYTPPVTLIPTISPMKQSIFLKKDMYFVSNKVIEMPTLMKKQINYNDGVETVVENIAFDPNTGDPLIQRKNDSYTDNTSIYASTTDTVNMYYTVDIKASQAYPNMQSKSKNQELYFQSNNGSKRSHNNFTFQQISGVDYINVGKVFTGVTYRGANKCDFLKFIFPGDLLKISSSSNPSTSGDFYVDAIDCQYIKLIGTAGGSLNGQLVDFEVIQSSKSNKLKDNFSNLLLFNPDTLDNTRLPKTMLDLENTLSSTNYRDYNNAWSDRVNLVNKLNDMIEVRSNTTTPTIVSNTGTVTVLDYNGWSGVEHPTATSSICVSTQNGTTNLETNKINIYMTYIEPNKTRGDAAEHNDLGITTYDTEVSGGPFYDYPTSSTTSIKTRVVSLFIKIEVEDRYGTGDSRGTIVQTFSGLALQDKSGGIDNNRIIMHPTFSIDINGDIKYNNQLSLTRNNYYVLEAGELKIIKNTLLTDDEKETLKADFTEVGQHYYASPFLEVIDFCNPAQMDLVAFNKNKIVSSQATQFSNTYDYEYKRYQLGLGETANENPNQISKVKYEKKYLSVSQNIFYKSPEMTASANNYEKYDAKSRTTFLTAGTIDTFQLFNPVILAENNRWQKQHEVLSYTTSNDMANAINEIRSRNGIAYDMNLGILPSYALVSGNTNSAFFESFEAYDKTNFYYSTPNWISQQAHTGSQSLRLKSQESAFFLSGELKGPLTVTPYLAEMWVKYSPYTNTTKSKQEFILDIIDNTTVKLHLFTIADGSNTSNSQIYTVSTPTSTTMAIKKQIGEWYLMRAEFNIPAVAEGNLLKFKLETMNSSHVAGDSILIDDFRILPYDASMTSYVYDWKNNYQLKSILDDSHIPVKIIYNDKNELKGKSIRTVNGEKLTNESFQNIPKVSRTTALSGVDYRESSGGGSAIKQSDDSNTDYSPNQLYENNFNRTNRQTIIGKEIQEKQLVDSTDGKEMKNAIKSKLNEIKPQPQRIEPGDILDKRFKELEIKKQKDYSKGDTIEFINIKRPILNIENNKQDSISNPKK